jgi:membrane protease YdiL (CAAX protease family)
MAKNMPRGRLIAILGGLLLTVGLPLAHANQYGEWFLGLSPLASRDLFWWPLFIGMPLYVRFVEGRPLSSIGFRRPDWLTLVLGIGVVLFVHYGVNWIASFLVDYFHMSTAAGNNASLAISNTPLWYRVLLVTRGGVGEEIVFRGYMIERVEELTGSRVLAGAVSVVVFTLAHLAYWGLAPLVFVSIAGLVLTLLYQWRRDLWANIFVHWVTDAWVVLLP